MRAEEMRLLSNIIKMDLSQTLPASRMIKPKAFEPDVQMESETDPAAKAHYDRMILQGRQEAQQLIDLANQQADEMRKEVALEKERWIEEKKVLAENAWNEGYHEGLKQGRSDGLSEYSQLISTAREIVNQTRLDAHLYIEEAEQTILELAIASAEAILGTTLSEHPDYFIEIVKKGLREFKEERSIAIYVHPSQYQVVLGARRSLEAVFPHEVKCYIYPDDELHGNDCLVETDSGKVSAGSRIQLQELKDRLTELLKAGEQK